MPEKIEKIMKRIHVFFSNCDSADGTPDRIIVPKKPMFNLLQELNMAVYEIMEQYEVTQTGRERELKRQKMKADAIIEEAGDTAEDIYAASMIYTDRILLEVRDMIEQAGRNLKDEYEYLAGQLEEQIDIVTNNQNEIRDYLGKTKQNNKYRSIIKDYNDKISELRKKEAKEREKAERARLERERMEKERMEWEEAERGKTEKDEIIRNSEEEDVKEDKAVAESELKRYKEIKNSTLNEKTSDIGTAAKTDNMAEIKEITNEENVEYKGDKFRSGEKIDAGKIIEALKLAKPDETSESNQAAEPEWNKGDEKEHKWADRYTGSITRKAGLREYKSGFDIDDDINIFTYEKDAGLNSADKQKMKEIGRPVKKVASVVDASAMSADVQEDNVKRVSYEIKVNPMYFQAAGEFSIESLDAEYEQWKNNGDDDTPDSDVNNKASVMVNTGKKGRGKKSNKKNVFSKKKKGH